jgi:hypothetical protein
MKRALCLLLASGCDLYFGHSAPTSPAPDALISPPAAPTNDLDVLFVIDNSASTADNQAVLGENFTAMVTALDNLPAGRPNLHVGVVNTTVDLGVPTFNTEGCPSPDPDDNGLLRGTVGVGASAGCPTPSGNNYIVDLADGSGRVTNYPSTAQLPDVMACIGAVGTEGCGFTAPLEAMKRALDGTNPANAGFLRDGAALLVVIVADRDDCSAAPALFALADEPPSALRCAQYGYTCDQPISAMSPATYTGCVPRTGSYLYDAASYAAFLATIKNPAQTAVAVIAGDPASTITTGPRPSPASSDALVVQPSCTATVNGTAGTSAQPADCIVSFASAFANEGFFTVCSADYRPALTSAVGLGFQAMTL